MGVSVLADPDVEAARGAFVAAGVAEADIVTVGAPSPAQAALEKGRRVVTVGPVLAAVDVITDVTPSPTIAATVTAWSGAATSSAPWPNSWAKRPAFAAVAA